MFAEKKKHAGSDLNIKFDQNKQISSIQPTKHPTSQGGLSKRHHPPHSCTGHTQLTRRFVFEGDVSVWSFIFAPLSVRRVSVWVDKTDPFTCQHRFLSVKLNQETVASYHRCPSTRLFWAALRSEPTTRARQATRWEKAPWVIKVLITLRIFMDTIKNKTAIKKIADCRAKSPKDPISSWSTWWTLWQADCFPAPIFGACEKWSTQLVCGLRWVINLVLSPPWW